MSSKYTVEILQEAVDNSISVAGVLRYLGCRQAGGTQAYISRKIKEFGIDTSHFLGKGHLKGGKPINRRTSADILIVRPSGSNREKRPALLRAMIESGLEYRCRCGLTGEWQGGNLTLEIDHVNGDWLDNRLDNLRFLCPNCHSQEEHSNMPHKYR